MHPPSADIRTHGNKTMHTAGDEDQKEQNIRRNANPNEKYFV
jgi:hypothetical protein